MEGVRKVQTSQKPTNFQTNINKVSVKEFKIDMNETGRKQAGDFHSCRYDNVPSNHKGATEVVVGVPVFVNPNKYEAVTLVTRKIGQENGIHRYGGIAS